MCIKDVRRYLVLSFFSFFILSFSNSFANSKSTLDTVREKGHVTCGINQALIGFSTIDEKGIAKGLDVDVCRAVAAAVFGDKDKVKFKPLSAITRFTALQSGEVDVLTRNSTHTLQRGTKLGLNFGPVNFYDGQRIMVPKTLGITSAMELDGASICILQGTTTELNITDFFRKHKMKYKPIAYEDINEVKKSFFNERCDVYTGDGSEVASIRMESGKPENYVVLPEVISKEPLAPVVRHGDDQWLDVVSYAFYAMINAEELNINSTNIETIAKTTTDPKIKRFLGLIPGNGKYLGLPEDFAFQIIKQVGNYGESYDRHVGTPLALARGLNELWVNGGLMYSPPFK